jgi:hypothetical protein
LTRKTVMVPMLFLAVWGLLLSACTDEGRLPESEGEEDAVRVTAESGPVKVTLSIAPREPRLSDEPVFTIAVESEEGVDYEIPPFGEFLGEFLIRDVRDPLPETRGDRRVTRRVYRLEPVRTGEHLIHPFVLTFTDNRTRGDGKEHSVETEGLTVTVKSVLGEEIPSLADLKPAGGPQPIPAEPFNYLWLLTGIPVVGLLLFFALRKKKEDGAAAAPRLSPREMAWLELQRLVDAGYLERGELQIYFTELTGVVRRFIERTMGVRAPEQTTEEFLREAGRTDRIPEGERERLGRFLEAADLVKFAAFRPSRGEIEASFERAKEFLGLDGEDRS